MAVDKKMAAAAFLTLAGLNGQFYSCDYIPFSCSYRGERCVCSSSDCYDNYWDGSSATAWYCYSIEELIYCCHGGGCCRIGLG